MTFRIWAALESLQYLDSHEPQCFDFCIECTPTDGPGQLYHHLVKIMIIYEGTNNLVSGAFLKRFSIYSLFLCQIHTCTLYLCQTLMLLCIFLFYTLRIRISLRFRNTAKMATLKMKLCIFADELASLIPCHHK